MFHPVDVCWCGFQTRCPANVVATPEAACRGDRDSDRTAGQAALQDFRPFVDAGITTFDTAGSHLLPACPKLAKASSNDALYILKG